jgi:hypothetical protein
MLRAFWRSRWPAIIAFRARARRVLLSQYCTNPFAQGFDGEWSTPAALAESSSRRRAFPRFLAEPARLRTAMDARVKALLYGLPEVRSW